jgi:hypothetical protein
VQALCAISKTTHRNFRRYLTFRLRRQPSSFTLVPVRESVGLIDFSVPSGEPSGTFLGALRKRRSPGSWNNPRAIASRRGRQSFGADRLPCGRSHAANGRDGECASFVTTCLPVDPLSSLRSAADRTGSDPSLRAGRWPKGALGLGPGAIRDRCRGAAGGSVERGIISIGSGLPRGSPNQTIRS